MSKEEDNRLADKAHRWCRGETTIEVRDEQGNVTKVHKNAEPYAPAVGSLLNLLVEVRNEERERCAKIVEDWRAENTDVGLSNEQFDRLLDDVRST
jgi:hypothetical protein